MTTVGRLKEGDLYITGELAERRPVINNGLLAHYPFDGDTKTHLTKFKVVAEAYGTNGPYDGGLWTEDGTLVRSYSRSWQISVWDMLKNKWATGINFYGASRFNDGTHACFDTYDSAIRDAQQKGFADTLNNLNGNYLVIITGTHAPEHFDSRMIDAIKRCGGTTSKLSWAGSRKSYICIGEVGCGEGNAISECLDNMEPSPTQSRWAEAEVGLYGRMASASGVILPTGIAMEASTTNLASVDGSAETAFGEHVGDVAVSNGTGTTLGGGWRASTHYNDAKCKVIRTNTPAGEGNAFRWTQGHTVGWKAVTGSSCTVEASKTYTASVYVRVNGYANPNAYGFYGDSSHRFYVQWEKTPRLYQNEWVRGTYTFTPTTTHTGSIYLYGDSDAQAGSTVDYCLYQIEEQPYATTFAKTVRTSGGGTIDSSIGTSNFTIIGEFTPSTDSDSLANYLYFLNLGNGMILKTYNGSPYIDGNSITGVSGNNVHLNFNTKQGVKVHYVIQRNGTTFSWRMKAEDGQDFTWTKTDARVTGFVVDSLSFSAGWSGIHKDLSIYNRALSESEVEKLLASKMSIQKDGDINSQIRERAVGVPSGAAHFPFDAGDSGAGRAIAPIDESKTVYEEGAVWLSGNSTVNLYANPIRGFDSNAHMTISDEVFPNPLGLGDTVRKAIHPLSQNRGGDQRLYQTVTSQVNATDSFTYSAWIYIPEGQKHQSATPFWRAYQSTDTNHWTGNDRIIKEKRHDPNLTDTWQRIWVTFKGDPNDAGTNYFVNYYHQIEVDNFFYMTGGQLEKSAYPTPFTATTRGSGKLHYPYNMVNLSQNFTVMGWWKPNTVGDGTYNPAITFNRRSGNYTSRRILIMDQNTSSTRLRGWVGGGTTETSVYAPSSPGIQTETWNFFAFIKEGATVKLWHGVNGSLGYGSNSSGGTNLETLWDGDGTTTFIDANWGWIIGEYSGSSHTSNGHFKDYSFVQSALSDAEVEKIYRTQMRNNKNTLQVQGQIKEGKVL